MKLDQLLDEVEKNSYLLSELSERKKDTLMRLKVNRLISKQQYEEALTYASLRKINISKQIEKEADEYYKIGSFQLAFQLYNLINNEPKMLSIADHIFWSKDIDFALHKYKICYDKFHSLSSISRIKLVANCYKNKKQYNKEKFALSIIS